MNLSKTKQGDFLILIQAFLSSFFPIVAVLSYKTLTPMVSLFYSSVFTAGVFLILFCFRPKWRELIIPGVLKELLFVALIIGVGYYGLFFLALKYTTAGNASLIALMEIFFSYLFFHVIRKEDMGASHIIGGIFMVLGAVMILFNKTSSFRAGDFIILFATTFPAVGNYFQQKLRKKISSETVLFGRSMLTLPFLAILAFVFKENLSPAVIRGSFWFLLLNGTIFLGISKIFWLEGIHRISVTKASIISSVSPAFTLLLATIFLKQYPNLWQLLAFIPLGLGLWLLTKTKPVQEAEMGSV
ncbi:MAG: DMT family transporter [Patescibacteria group bacterium]